MEVDKKTVKISLHIRLGRCEYDYLLEDLKLFVEYHVWDRSLTAEQYYDKRRNNLNKYGYDDYELVVIP